MFGDAEIEESEFDYLLDHPRYDFDLYCPPNLPLSTVDYAIASACQCPGARWRHAADRDRRTRRCDCLLPAAAAPAERDLRQLLEDGGVLARSGAAIEAVGGTGPFQQGLFAALGDVRRRISRPHRSGILKRRVFPHLPLQRVLNAGAIGERVTPEICSEQLLAAGLPGRLSADEFAMPAAHRRFQQRAAGSPTGASCSALGHLAGSRSRRSGSCAANSPVPVSGTPQATARSCTPASSSARRRSTQHCASCRKRAPPVQHDAASAHQSALRRRASPCASSNADTRASSTPR